MQRKRPKKQTKITGKKKKLITGNKSTKQVPRRLTSRKSIERKDNKPVRAEDLPIAEKTLMAGFTTVRDLGGSGVNISLRNAINAGSVRGPRIFTAGKAIGTTGGHADPTNGWRKDLMGDPDQQKV